MEDPTGHIYNWHRRCLKTSEVFDPSTVTWYQRPAEDLMRELQQHYYGKIMKCQEVLKSYRSYYQLCLYLERQKKYLAHLCKLRGYELALYKDGTLALTEMLEDMDLG